MARQASLWRHPDFLKLWTAHTLASLSSNVTTLALPLIAALTLHASPFGAVRHDGHAAQPRSRAFRRYLG